ncbi:MAG: chromosomal replication initiator protein DnaA [Clostridia bacterium]|nr:chromosomal replication initiator protein DnaA [Clostridia bacterium]MBQ2738062.1 chromosomal replication initiator protein DnaA [Clostridia bacterium]MBQ8290534.1 chromosomal replication initiator protein DnaA [Clostridia bacterium]
MDDLQSIVDTMLPILDEKLGIAKSSFNLWFGYFGLVSLDGEKAVFSTINSLRKDILTKKYIGVIREALAEVIGFEVDIEIQVVKDNSLKYDDDTVEEIKPTPEDEEENRKRAETINKMISEPSDDSKSKFDEYTFSNFIEGASNKFAKKACEAVADTFPADDYNPLFIYGNSGLGKTHLLCAIINHMKEKFPKLNIVYKTCEEFLNEMVSHLGTNSMDEFKERYRSADVLLIDDVQFLGGKVQTQEEFFHTFNFLYEANKRIILSSDRPPHEIKPLEDRIRSRFEGGLLADIQPPSAELRFAIIKRKSENLGFTIPTHLIEYISERLHENIRQIEGVVKKMHMFIKLQGSSVEKDLIDRCITAVDPGNIPVDILIDRIIKQVSEFYGVSVDTLKSNKRTANVAHARHIAVYIIKKLTEKSYQDIGDIFNRDHTTIMSSCTKIETEIRTKKNIDRDIKTIINLVKGV